MRTIVVTATAVALGCLALVGCAADGEPNTPGTKDLQHVLDVACPMLSVIDASSHTPNKYQRSAMATLALACPPNPPPTSAVVAVEDIIAAYAVLQPLSKH